MADEVDKSESENPYLPYPGQGRRNQDWWPDQLKLGVLHQHSSESSPLDDDYDYATAVASLDVDALKADLIEVMTTSQDWWPADYGHYGPLFIRLSWHAAGTYRIADGRGGGGTGAQRFAPLNSWPDNGNLDKARRLLWPVKQKYGKQISWADLLVLAGNVALESMGFETFGFAFGREDIWAPEEDIYWGNEDEWLDDKRYSGDRELSGPLGAVQMGLIYVNPEGPNGNPDPISAARDIRETFARMAMNDEETVALIAGGHTFGKTHGAGDADLVGPEPEAAPARAAGHRLDQQPRQRQGPRLDHQRDRGRLDPGAHEVGQRLLRQPLRQHLRAGAEPGRREPVAGHERGRQAGARSRRTRRRRAAPSMLTTDLSLKEESTYDAISRRFHEDPAYFADTFAKAWFKLLHRDMGPISRYLGPLVPSEPQLWQDPVPDVDHELVGDAEVADLKRKVLDAGLTVQQLVATAWASAASYRGTDMRGGANGARVRLAPQKDWPVNDPEQLASVLSTLEGVQQDFNGSQSGGVKISLADLIVLGGVAAVEKAAKDAGHDVTVPFSPGRTDATQEWTDADTFEPLEPKMDGFRNYATPGEKWPAEQWLVERANLLTLTAPEMTVLLGGLRALDANAGGTKHGVLTDKPGTLTNDFFLNLLDTGTAWTVSKTEEGVYEGSDRGHRCGQVDRHCGRPGLRCELAAAGHRRGVRRGRRRGEVRQRLRQGLEQGHEPRPVRPQARHGQGHHLVPSHDVIPEGPALRSGAFSCRDPVSVRRSRRRRAR